MLLFPQATVWGLLFVWVTVCMSKDRFNLSVLHWYFFMISSFSCINVGQHFPSEPFLCSATSKESATFMSSFTLWWVDMPPTLFPVCLGFASASHNSTYYFMINTSTQQSENMKVPHNTFGWVICILKLGIRSACLPLTFLHSSSQRSRMSFFLICMLGSPHETSWHKTLQYFQMRPAARLRVLAHPVPQDPQTSNQSGWVDCCPNHHL